MSLHSSPIPSVPPHVKSSAASENEADPAGLESSKWGGPLDGLRRFSRDGVDGVFMGAAGVPVRYRL